MQPVERNPLFTNSLLYSTSPYLRQHAHNPVYWYPWGKEAIERARAENKPILLSIGYSTCYWCHVMEREVFKNLSIASLMNRNFINIKVDREEHPEIDEIYMVARQLMTHEGGWPNNVFLTPDLKPFYAGGTFAPDDAYGKPAFPRLLEWLFYSWTTQEESIRQQSEEVMKVMLPYLVHEVPEGAEKPDVLAQADQLFAAFKDYHDERAGGFFQSPKFPHECYHNFLTTYFECTDNVAALDIVRHSLGKMAAGGIYDHVGCGFHRYAVDKEWYVPHFEKMLYNQALLARNYTDAARLTGSEYLADIAKSILDFVSGPFTEGNGAFYSAFDAETDAVEGAYYAWSPEQLKEVLNEEESRFLVNFYALADIPAFPGHKHPDGQVIVARVPLDLAAAQNGMQYAELAAMSAHVMNKLLLARNVRRTPGLDDKIVLSWNALMIDAYAHAARVFDIERYTQIASRAANFILEKMIDNDGKLCRIFTAGQLQLEAQLEDYAYLIKALITLWRATGDKKIFDAAISLSEQVEEKFADKTAPGYFGTSANEYLVVRIKSADDSTLPCPNAVMLGNLVDLFEITKEARYRDNAQAMVDYFLAGSLPRQVEAASMLQHALRLVTLLKGKAPRDLSFVPVTPESMETHVTIATNIFPADAKPGDNCEILIGLDIEEGWHINAAFVNHEFLTPTQIDVQGDGVELIEIIYPEPLRQNGGENEDPLLIYKGLVNITARMRLTGKGDKRSAIKLAIRFQPCDEDSCRLVRDIYLTL